MRFLSVLLTVSVSFGLVFEKATALSPLTLISRCQATATIATSSPEPITLSRRNLIQSAMATATTVTLLSYSGVAQAMSMVTTDEFTSIVRDSARSIDVVEFSGPKSETVVVRLVDGTNFGIKDVIESPIDPRSPLKIAAVCNANNVSYKFLDLEAILASSSRKKKVYANSRVLEAAEKQREKALRMQEDDELRQAELAEMSSR